MIASFASRPSTKADRLGPIRAAKAAIQSAQQQQQPGGSHPLPPRPSPSQVPRPTANTSTDWQTPPLGSMGGGSGGGGAGSSGSGGGRRK
jgi:hypothetical protein